MTHKLFTDIAQFEQWAQANGDVSAADYWECDYDDWQTIFTDFEDYIKTADPNSWTEPDKNGLLTIIARDNEGGYLVKLVATNQLALYQLAKSALEVGPKDAKWQLVTQLHTLEDHTAAVELLEQFFHDPAEYVNRMALLELARLQSPTTEQYCQLTWNDDNEASEYRRMAVLKALSIIHSELLPHYLQLAKADGRTHLMHYVNELET